MSASSSSNRPNGVKDMLVSGLNQVLETSKGGASTSKAKGSDKKVAAASAAQLRALQDLKMLGIKVKKTNPDSVHKPVFGQTLVGWLASTEPKDPKLLEDILQFTEDSLAEAASRYFSEAESIRQESAEADMSIRDFMIHGGAVEMVTTGSNYISPSELEAARLFELSEMITPIYGQVTDIVNRAIPEGKSKLELFMLQARADEIRKVLSQLDGKLLRDIGLGEGFLEAWSAHDSSKMQERVQFVANLYLERVNNLRGL